MLPLGMRIEPRTVATDFQTIPQSVDKKWKETVTPESRSQLIQKLIQAMSNTHNAESNARKIEANLYDTANSRFQYYYLLAEKIYSIREKLDENSPELEKNSLIRCNKND